MRETLLVNWWEEPRPLEAAGHAVELTEAWARQVPAQMPCLMPMGTPPCSARTRHPKKETMPMKQVLGRAGRAVVSPRTGKQGLEPASGSGRTLGAGQDAAARRVEWDERELTGRLDGWTHWLAVPLPEVLGGQAEGGRVLRTMVPVAPVRPFFSSPPAARTVECRLAGDASPLRVPLPPQTMGAAPALALRWRAGGAELVGASAAPAGSAAAGALAAAAAAAADSPCSVLRGGAVHCDGLLELMAGFHVSVSLSTCSLGAFLRPEHLLFPSTCSSVSHFVTLLYVLFHCRRSGLLRTPSTGPSVHSAGWKTVLSVPTRKRQGWHSGHSGSATSRRRGG